VGVITLTLSHQGRGRFSGMILIKGEKYKGTWGKEKV